MLCLLYAGFFLLLFKTKYIYLFICIIVCGTLIVVAQYVENLFFSNNIKFILARFIKYSIFPLVLINIYFPNHSILTYNLGNNVSWESWFIKKTSYCCEGRSWLTYLINYNTVSRTAPARPSHLFRVLEKYTTHNISVPTHPQLLAWVDLPCQIDLYI